MEHDPYRPPQAGSRPEKVARWPRWALRLVGLLLAGWAGLMIVGYPLLVARRVEELEWASPGFWGIIVGYFAIWLVQLTGGAGLLFLRPWARIPALLGAASFMAYGPFGMGGAVLMVALLLSKPGRNALDPSSGGGISHGQSREVATGSEP